MATIQDIVVQMRASLRVAEPDLDTSIGTPVRKIIDVVAEVVAEASVDKYLLDYQYDIDSKSGADLDDFVALFGFSRLPAKRATGSVVFERSTASTTSNIMIPMGSQVATEDSVPVIVATVVPAVLPQGEYSIAVPVQAVVGGAQGNVSAESLRRRVTPLDGVNSFSNPAALSGGADPESDVQLRLRFKRTVFRNLAGTEQMYLGIALDDAAVTHANVIGAMRRRREQIEVVGGQAVSTLQDAKYVYPGPSFFGTDLDSGAIFTPDVHYTFDPGPPVVVESLDGTVVPDGVYELEYEYLPLASRNDPEHGITNRVDVYVNGERATVAAETAVFRSSRVFSTTDGDPMAVGNFERESGDPPEVGNFFIPLAFAPVMDPAPDDSIVIGGVSYDQDVDFWLVNDISSEGGTPQSLSGIELRSTANGATQPEPPDGEVFGLEYVFNAVPRDVQLAVRSWRLVTTDARVHQAKRVLLTFNLAVIFVPGFTEETVRGELEDVLSRYVAQVGFNGAVQVSDVLEVAHRVPGIDAVRFLTSNDPWLDPDDASVHYAIERVNPFGDVLERYETTVPGQIGRALDVLLADDQTPVFNRVNITQRAMNTFGAV